MTQNMSKKSSIRLKILCGIIAIIIGIAVFTFLYFPSQQKKTAILGLEEKAISLSEMTSFVSSASVRL